MDQDNHPNNRSKEQAPKGTAMVNQQLTAAKPIAKDRKGANPANQNPNPASKSIARLRNKAANNVKRCGTNDNGQKQTKRNEQQLQQHTDSKGLVRSVTVNLTTL